MNQKFKEACIKVWQGRPWGFFAMMRSNQDDSFELALGRELTKDEQDCLDMCYTAIKNYIEHEIEV